MTARSLLGLLAIVALGWFILLLVAVLFRWWF